MRKVLDLLATTMAPQQPDALGASAGTASAVALGGIGALHLAWGLGSTFPSADAQSLARVVVGSDRFPSPAACVVVAGLLGVASVVAVSRARPTSPVGRLIPPPVAGLGAAVVASVLAVRGVGGFIVGAIGHPRTTPAFRVLDLVVYSPLCVALALGIRRIERPRP